TEVPDLLFAVKTGCNIPVDQKLRQIIEDVQAKRPTPDEEGMWFRLKDFEGKLD
ncbi:1691_t:CDS:1, partial [Acaulospora colombiana]